LNILVIAAHPDDEVLGMGGTIRKYAKKNHKIHLCVVSEGATAQYSNKKMIQVREKACKNSGKILGITKYDFLGFPDMRLDTIPHLEMNQKLEKIIGTIQDESKFIEYWEKRTPKDGKIDWTRSGKEIHNLIRASTYPYPGAFTFFKGDKLIIWKADFIDENGNEPGKIQVNDARIQIGTGDGIILLKLVSWKDMEKINASKLFSHQDQGEKLGD